MPNFLQEYYPVWLGNVNPLTAVPHIFGFLFLLAHQVPPFKHVKDTM